MLNRLVFIAGDGGGKLPRQVIGLAFDAGAVFGIVG